MKQKYTARLVHAALLSLLITPGVLLKTAPAQEPATVEAPAAIPSGRIFEGLVAAYSFTTHSETGFPDISGVEELLPLRFFPENPEQSTEDGLVVINAGPRALRSEKPATKIAETIRYSEQMTLEVWLCPASLDQRGPARIVSMSGSTGADRNFTLGQEKDRYAFRIRKTSRDKEDGFQILEIQTPKNSVPTEPHQTVVTYEVCPDCGTGIFRAFVNAECVTESAEAGGGLDTWLDDLPLLIGNEFSMDRTWRGAIYGVAIYARALSMEEINRNYLEGPPTEQ